MAQAVIRLNAILDRHIGIDGYIRWSTVIAALLFVPIRGTFLLGYAVALFNSLLLIALDRLAIHRNHLLTLLAIASFSFVVSQSSGTSSTAIMAQIAGITVMSVYYFSVITHSRITPLQWMEMYLRVAFGLAVLALLIWPMVTAKTGDPRLRAIYSEPSYYIYMTLPAVGYCIDAYVRERRYVLESLVFLLTYLLADSALGFLGLLLIGLFTFGPRLKGWQLLLGLIAGCALMGGLYFGSQNFRARINDVARAIVAQDLSGTGSSTFAFLSNVYVTSQSFLAHPFTGVGIGGYATAYDKYIGDIHGLGLYFLNDQLNRDDANSMILRVATELGIPGLIALFGLLIVCARVRGAPYSILRNALLPYLIVRTTRLGAYFTVELYFFVALYVVNFLEFRASQQPKSLAQPGAGAATRRI
jgi:hypothetical protein